MVCQIPGRRAFSIGTFEGQTFPCEYGGGVWQNDEFCAWLRPKGSLIPALPEYLGAEYVIYRQSHNNRQKEQKLRLKKSALPLFLWTLPFACAALTAAALGGESPVCLGSFEQNEGWKLSLGKEFPGAQGGFTLDGTWAKAGERSAWLEGMFGDGGTYVAISKSFAKPLDLQNVSLWIKTTDLSHLTFRIMDASGQSHQQKIKLADTADWQHLTVESFAPTGEKKSPTGYLSFGGKADGIWHGPARSLTLILESGALKKKTLKNYSPTYGQCWIDKIEAIAAKSN